ncbi:hypothetical protein [Streptomyces sp. NPDC088180]|uniref:hypothetical protein n=1 Tax=Streptomyces sp. NPDC088180 TaxID=3365837 RepID=UPI00381BDEBD
MTDVYNRVFIPINGRAMTFRPWTRAGLAVGELAQGTEEGEGFGDLADGADGVAQGDSAEGCVLDQRGRWMWVWSMTLFRLMVQA